MPHNPNNKRVLLVVSPAQHEALAKLAEAAGSDVADLIRRTLLEKFPSIPDDLPARGKYKRGSHRDKPGGLQQEAREQVAQNISARTSEPYNEVLKGLS